MSGNPASASRAISLVTEILDGAPRASSPDDFMQSSLEALQAGWGGTWLACRQESTVWKAWHGVGWQRPQHGMPPDEALAETLDREQVTEWPGLVLVPLEAGPPACVLANWRLPGELPSSGESVEGLAGIAAAIRMGLQLLTTAGPNQQRLQRLEAILQVVGRWSEHQQIEQLLIDLAESSTRLLDAERASIFLWDRPRHQLIACPALGVEGGELRVPDDQGVVGAVVHSGRPERVDADNTAAINRSVDERLGFRTRNLVCVPLHTPSGECLGAFELINKRIGNFTASDTEATLELAHHAAVALATAQDRDRLFQSRRQIADEAADKVRLIGDSAAMAALRSTIQRVAGTDLALLILGENGTGKEVVSQMVHYLSRRRDEPFVAVNCAAIAETLLESELFGHEKGAFTDAREARAGKFELAAGGTLFLDEIGDLSLSGQAKLLRVLEEKIVVRVGGSVPIPTDARVLAATNQDLAQRVRDGKFREDLFFRLNVVTLKLPPLRDRPDDIPQLAKFFLQTFSKQAGRRPPQFTPRAVQRMLQHSWPGNVRELRNLMERLAYLTAAESIDGPDLDFVAGPRSESAGGLAMGWGLTEATRMFQIDYIQRHVKASRGNLSLAAEHLGLHRSNLYRKMKQLGIHGDESDSSDPPDATAE